MAYMSQEKKKAIEPKVKAILAKYGIKGRLGVRHHSTLVLRIASGKLDFMADYNSVNSGGEYFRPETKAIQVNVYHADKHFSGQCAACLAELIDAMNTGNHDNSNAQYDHFDVGFYISIDIGQWDKPYIVE